MTSLFRKFTWWMQRRRMEHQLQEELQFHLSEEADERRASGLPADQARLAARLDLGNPALVQEDALLVGYAPAAQSVTRRSDGRPPPRVTTKRLTTND